MPVKEKLLLDADIIIKALTDCETVQNGHDSDYFKKQAKISAYDYIIELLGVKGEANEETL